MRSGARWIQAKRTFTSVGARLSPAAAGGPEGELENLERVFGSDALRLRTAAPDQEVERSVGVLARFGLPKFHALLGLLRASNKVSLIGRKPRLTVSRMPVCVSRNSLLIKSAG